MQSTPKTYLSWSPGAGGACVIHAANPIHPDQPDQATALRKAQGRDVQPTHRFNRDTGAMTPLTAVLCDALNANTRLEDALRDCRAALGEYIRNAERVGPETLQQMASRACVAHAKACVALKPNP